MQRLTYYSIAAQPMVEREIRQLASYSSQANAAANITGMLFFNGRHFVQTIEGMPDDLAKLFSRIRKDERHK
ncbi:MAG: BLUF domain-containing protein, partial [Beijerinckiaceae bacterium]